MNRGDIYWIDLNPTTGSEINKQRPCVLVGATPINQARHTLVVVPLFTSASARPPITISVTCLNKPVTAVCDQIRTVDKSRLKSFIGALSDKDLDSLDEGLRQVLSL
ncbi:MAG: type II toxin-antitoxin system PemK/MazF family toxin [Legionella longbeachae]|nr:type II toxin-antitoxin system PemK/MazF family toxin [Legionella longbeachae]